MWRHPKRLMALRRDETGVTAVEYGLITALIALAMLSALGTLGTNLRSLFAGLASHFGAPGT